MAPSNQSIKNSQGSMLLELLICLALFMVVSPAILNGLVNTRMGEPQQQQRLQAAALLKETKESLRVIREKGWDLFSADGTYYPQLLNNSWVLQSGTQTIGDFTRYVVISDVFRNSNSDIAASGQIDPSTKKVTAYVSWDKPSPSTISLVNYFTRYLDNLTYKETTVADFNAGLHVGTTVTNTSGGEVILGTRGRVDWCKPSLSISALNLPGQAYATDISAIEGRAYVTTGGNSSGDSMDKINISNDYPPVATNGGIYQNFKTYSIFASTTYNYLTSDHPGISVDIVNPVTLTSVGYFNPSGGGKGKSVYVDGTIGFVTVGNKLFSFDVSTITGSNQPQLGSLTLAGNGEKVIVSGGYAYVALSGSSTMLQTIAVTNGGRSLTVIGNANLNSQSATAVAINSTGTRAYVTTQASLTQNEVFVIDTSNKTVNATPNNLPLIGSYDTNGMDPKGIVAVSGNHLIVVGSGGEQYQVITLANESQPIRCGGLVSPLGATAINAIATVTEADGDSYSYILTNNANQEFQIIEGGPGGAVGFNGVFTSKIFSLSSDTGFNRYEINSTVPVNTQINYQFAIAHSVNGSCQTANYVYVGPDGTPNTSFTSNSAALPLSNDGVGYENPGSCFRYKVTFFSSDSSQTPVFNDITVNYSP